MKISYYDTLVSRFLLATCRGRAYRLTRPLWSRLYASGLRRNRAVAVKIHGYDVVTNFGNTYPFTLRRFPTFNAPLLDLINAAFAARGCGLRMVDVGAAIGDTVLPAESNCPGMIAEYICIDGDSEFFRYLSYNLARFPHVQLINAQLSRSIGNDRSLIRTQAGTASAQGNETVLVQPLDDILSARQTKSPIDLLKIDADGLDGAILAGSQMLLQNDKPFVIFEWHPILCRQTGNDPREAFDNLCAAGYRTFLWFNKFGAFSHVSANPDERTLDLMACHCLRDIAADWHYDVVALHPSNSLDLDKVVSGDFSRKRRSRL